MEIQAYKTDPVVAGSDLYKILDTFLPKLQEDSVVAITSKIVSICQGRLVAATDHKQKKELIHQEASQYLEDPDYYDKYHISLTIKEGQLIPSSGIDESNGNGMFILWPKEPYKTAASVWKYLKEKNTIKNLGVIITDSHTTPLRWGVTGTTVAWCGFKPLYDYTEKPDIFGRPFKFEKTNIIDSLATAATYVMGEGNETTPIAILTDIPHITFLDNPPTEKDIRSLQIEISDDIYAPLLTRVAWKKGGDHS